MQRTADSGATRPQRRFRLRARLSLLVGLYVGVEPQAGTRPEPPARPAQARPARPRVPSRKPSPLPELPGFPVLAGGALPPMAGPAAPPPVPEGKPSRINEEELMLFTVLLGKRVVAQNFPGYPLGGANYLLPLGEFCRCVGLGIRVEPATGVAKGFILSEDRTFHLDLGQNRVVLAGKALPLDPGRLEPHLDDIYVDDAYLPQWLPLTLTINPLTAIIQVDPLAELPIQGQWRREAFPGRRSDPVADPALGLPVVRQPYALIDWPFLDQNLAFAQPTGAPGLSVTGSSFLAGDLCFMSSTLFFNSPDGDLFSNPRGRLFRRDPDAGLLGPMKANIVEFGDTFTPAPALVGGSPAGRGVHVGNFPEAARTAGDRTSLQGDLLPGWSVELYQNDSLLDIQLPRQDGQYLFLDLPLQYGVNDFRLVFCGPEGQRREERQRLDISQSQTPPGQLFYSLSTTRPGDGSTNCLAETAYGLSRRWDLRAALAQVPVTPPGEGAGGARVLQRFATAGTQGYWPDWSAWFGAARSSAGGTVGSALLGTGRGRASLTLQQSWLDGFYSPEFPASQGLIADRTRAQLNLALPGPSWMPSSVQMSLGHMRDRLADGGRSLQTTGRVSMNARGTYVSNAVTWSRLDTPRTRLEQREGTALVSRSFRQWSLRGEAAYRFQGPGPTLESLGLNADTKVFEPWLVQGSVTRDLAAADTRFAVGAVGLRGPVAVSLTAQHSRAARFFLGLGLHIALGREPRTGRWVASAAPMAGEGSISGLAYLDSAGTGARDLGEPLEGGGLAVNGSPRTAHHPGAGAIFTPNLRADSWATVTLAEGTVEDPLVKSRVAGYRVLPRVGKPIQLDFPLVVGSEITGSTQVQTSRGIEDLGGVRLELLDPEGRVRLQAVSAFDGFFDLADIAPGSCTLRVAPDEGRRLGLRLPPPRAFELSPRGSQFDGIQMILAQP